MDVRGLPMKTYSSREVLKNYTMMVGTKLDRKAVTYT
jgi:hypothetical protein